MRPAAWLLVSSVASMFAVSCYDGGGIFSSDVRAPSSAVTNGGVPQRLWDRYALRDVQGNPTPALLRDSANIQIRVAADTLFFTFATGEFREVAVVIRYAMDGSAETVVLTTPKGTRYAQTSAESLTFPSLLFGTTTATLSGVTSTFAFSRNLATTAGGGNYGIVF